MKTFIDLFCGIGGFRLALESFGLECVFSSDIDKNSCESYYKNFNEYPSGDIREIDVEDIPHHDVLCAGFPCQSFSISGSKHGLKDERGLLINEITRVASYHKPSVLLLENVSNIKNISKGDVINYISKSLTDLGYNVTLSDLNSSYFGIPQARRRVYFVCVRNDTGRMYYEPQANYKGVYLKDMLDTLLDDTLIVDRDDIKIYNEDDVALSLKPVRIGTINKGGQGERIYHPNGHAVTLTANGGGGGGRTGMYYIDGVVRKLSVNESKRVMGFPEDHVLYDGAIAYKQLGNAVIPEMVKLLYNSII